MRAKILDLAIRGKLTDQRQEDGNARDLLKEIQAEKEKLIKEKKIKKEKPLPEITEEEKPFEIPDSWEWVRLGEIGTIYGGGTPKTTESDYWNNGTIAWIRPADMNFSAKYIERGEKNITEKGLNKSSAKMFPKGSVIISTRATIGYVKIAKIDACTSQGCKTFGAYSQKLVLSVYIYYMIQQRMPDLEIRASGTTFKEIAGSGVAQTVIPLPPFAEQKRIADKISVLFAQLDAIDKAYEEYRKLQQTVKSKLLELAMQGKLTDQRDEDGDARELFQDIQEEKKRLIAEKKIKKEKPLPEIEADEIPFEIPTNWMWVRLGNICSKVVDGDHNPPKGENHPTPYIMASSQNINNDRLVNLCSVRYLSKEVFEKENLRTLASEGDIFFTSVGSLGRSCVYDGSLNICFQRSVSVITAQIYNWYLKRCFDSPYYQNMMYAEAKGTAQKGFYLKQLSNSLIPLPPLAEQKRIVAKLDELLPLL